MKMKIETLAKCYGVECIYGYICESAVNGVWSQVNELIAKAKKCEGWNTRTLMSTAHEMVDCDVYNSLLNRVMN